MYIEESLPYNSISVHTMIPDGLIEELNKGRIMGGNGSSGYLTQIQSEELATTQLASSRHPANILDESAIKLLSNV